jgi:hypothetical protein
LIPKKDTSRHYKETLQIPKRDLSYEGPPLFSSFMHSLLRYMEKQLKDDPPSPQERARIGIERIRTLTPQEGMEPPSWWAHTCLGFWFLILEHVRFAWIALGFSYHIPVHMLCILRNHICFIPIFSLVILRKNFCKYLMGMTEKAHRVAAFLFW